MWRYSASTTLHKPRMLSKTTEVAGLMTERRSLISPFQNFKIVADKCKIYVMLYLSSDKGVPFICNRIHHYNIAFLHYIEYHGINTRQHLCDECWWDQHRDFTWPMASWNSYPARTSWNISQIRHTQRVLLYWSITVGSVSWLVNRSQKTKINPTITMPDYQIFAHCVWYRRQR